MLLTSAVAVAVAEVQKKEGERRTREEQAFLWREDISGWEPLTAESFVGKQSIVENETKVFLTCLPLTRPSRQHIWVDTIGPAAPPPIMRAHCRNRRVANLLKVLARTSRRHVQGYCIWLSNPLYRLCAVDATEDV